MARTARSLVRSAATLTGAVAVAAGVTLAGIPAASAAPSSDINAAGLPLAGITAASGAPSFDVYAVDQVGRIDVSGTDTSGGRLP